MRLCRLKLTVHCRALHCTRQNFRLLHGEGLCISHQSTVQSMHSTVWSCISISLRCIHNKQGRHAALAHAEQRAPASTSQGRTLSFSASLYKSVQHQPSQKSMQQVLMQPMQVDSTRAQSRLIAASAEAAGQERAMH